MKISKQKLTQNREHALLEIHENVGSSETIRKTPPFYTFSYLLQDQHIYTQPFDWSCIEQFMPQHKKKYSRHFLEWFVGFSEGDGSFIIDSKNKRLFFTITQRDSALLKKLRTELGFGVICNDTKFPEIQRFTVTRRSHIKVLLHVFNGNLLLKKTQSRFALWLNYWNTITGETVQLRSRWTDTSLSTKQPESGFRLKQQQDVINSWRKNSQLWQTAWLSGFLEAEGCFAAGLEKNTPVLRFLLDQTGELEVLAHIRLLLGDYGTLWIRKSTPQQNGLDHYHYRFETKNREGLEQISKLITRFPLRTKKRIVYTRWQKLFRLLSLIRDEKSLTQKRKERIARLVQEIQNWAKKKKNKKSGG